MNETLQTVIVAIIVVAAGILLYRALRRPSGGCDDASGSDSGCGSCPLSDRCNKRKK